MGFELSAVALVSTKQCLFFPASNWGPLLVTWGCQESLGPPASLRLKTTPNLWFGLIRQIKPLLYCMVRGLPVEDKVQENKLTFFSPPLPKALIWCFSNWVRGGLSGNQFQVGCIAHSSATIKNIELEVQCTEMLGIVGSWWWNPNNGTLTWIGGKLWYWKRKGCVIGEGSKPAFCFYFQPESQAIPHNSMSMLCNETFGWLLLRFEAKIDYVTSGHDITFRFMTSLLVGPSRLSFWTVGTGAETFVNHCSNLKGILSF